MALKAIASWSNLSSHIKFKLNWYCTSVGREARWDKDQYWTTEYKRLHLHSTHLSFYEKMEKEKEKSSDTSSSVLVYIWLSSYTWLNEDHARKEEAFSLLLSLFNSRKAEVSQKSWESACMIWWKVLGTRCLDMRVVWEEPREHLQLFHGNL